MRNIKEMDKRLDEREQEIEELQQAKDDLQQRFAKIKDYLKQIHIEQQKGILSSNNLIWENIERLCDGLEILGGKE